MAHVNLLPWRAARRKQREREFFLQLGAAFVAALLVLFLWVFWMNLRIDNQNERNTYLQGEITQVDQRIEKIKDLEKTRQRLLARKDIIEQLQSNRSQMVHLFDELVKTIPPSARLNALKQSGDSMSLDGLAQSNASVAEYMRNIEASPWMGHADLRKTENTGGDTRMPYTFGLDVALNRPKPENSAPAAASQPGATSSAAKPAVKPELAEGVRGITGGDTVKSASTAAAPASAATSGGERP